MLVYRIVHQQFSKTLYASGLAGRWNSSGKKVIYAADSIALAFLENMVRRQGVGFNSDFKIMIIEIPDDIQFTIINAAQLKDGWRNSMNYTICQLIGDKWYNESSSLILKVPSAVLPDSNNYVLNAEHPDFNKVKIIDTTALAPDERIEDILKKYSRK